MAGSLILACVFGTGVLWEVGCQGIILEICRDKQIFQYVLSASLSIKCVSVTRFQYHEQSFGSFV